MPIRRVCSFCGNEIEPGTGKMYIKKDGIVFHFCTNRCQRNMLALKRTPRRIKWTKHYVEAKKERLAERTKKQEKVKRRVKKRVRRKKGLKEE